MCLSTKSYRRGIQIVKQVVSKDTSALAKHVREIVDVDERVVVDEEDSGRSGRMSLKCRATACGRIYIRVKYIAINLVRSTVWAFTPPHQLPIPCHSIITENPSNRPRHSEHVAVRPAGVSARPDDAIFDDEIGTSVCRRQRIVRRVMDIAIGNSDILGIGYHAIP